LKAIVEYNNFFAYSHKNKKFFNTEFSNELNIVHGKNTSGKSTFLQSILYTFGINDEKRKLEELLSEDTIFRLDLTIKKPDINKVSIVRDDEILVIKVNDDTPIRFIGISGNNSREHIKLKSFLSKLLGFELYLEYEGEYKPASLEAMFLPYYVAQDVGWVYRHKSFRGLDFVRNFKSDFFDYYLGIVNNFDRLKKTKLDKQKKELEAECKLFHRIEENDKILKLSKLKDEAFISKSVEYIEPYKNNKSELIILEKDYLTTCNKLTRLEETRKVLQRIRRTLRRDIIAEDNCPTCSQQITHSTEDTYNYLQDLNDTDKQLSELYENIKGLKEAQGSINSLLNKIKEKKQVVESDYYELLEYSVDNLTFESWLKNKVDVELSEEVTKKIGENYSKILDINEQLKEFKPEETLAVERRSASNSFKNIFKKHVSSLKVKPFENERFYLLYDIPAFPRQGVELLKTLLAYNFAFIELIKSTEYTHILPFILDAIFEGDLEDESRQEILEFINKHKPINQQLIFSIADSKTNINSAETYNKIFFKDKAKLICIGENSRTRSFMNDYNDEFADYLEETLSILE
jgi:hypothetical protein